MQRKNNLKESEEKKFLGKKDRECNCIKVKVN